MIFSVQKVSTDKAVMAFTQGMLVSSQLVLRWIWRRFPYWATVFFRNLFRRLEQCSGFRLSSLWPNKRNKVTTYCSHQPSKGYVLRLLKNIKDRGGNYFREDGRRRKDGDHPLWPPVPKPGWNFFQISYLATFLIDISQTRTRRETAGKTMLTSTVVRRSRWSNRWAIVVLYGWTIISNCGIASNDNGIARDNNCKKQTKLLWYGRVRSTSLASSLRRTSKLSALLPGLRSGTSREKKWDNNIYFLDNFFIVFFFFRAPSPPTSRASLLCVVYFNPNQKIHENICCAVA